MWFILSIFKNNSYVFVTFVALFYFDNLHQHPIFHLFMMYWLWAINWGRVGYSMNGGTESGEPFVTG